VKISSIVEDHGKVLSVPILLRRFSEWRPATRRPEILMPIRVQRKRFLQREHEFQRHLQLAASKCGQDGWILILLDADEDCPVECGGQILSKARQIIPRRALSVVLAHRAFEAWFIASAASLHGHRSFVFDQPVTTDAESLPDARHWVKSQMGSDHYGETTDHPAFTQLMDLKHVHDGSRSFRKLCSEWDKTVLHAT
jgi:hypothetical protein